MPPGTRDFGLDALSDVASTAMDAVPGMKAQSNAGGGGQVPLLPENRSVWHTSDNELASATVDAAPSFKTHSNDNVKYVSTQAASLDQSIPFLEGNINRELLAPEHLRVPELEADSAMPPHGRRPMRTW